MFNENSKSRKLTFPRTFLAGTTTSSKVIPRVSEQRWPMFSSFLPTVRPGVSRSTMKPVNALLAGAFGSGLVRASTKYQLAGFALVILWRTKKRKVRLIQIPTRIANSKVQNLNKN